MSNTNYIGQSPKRVEDKRFTTGNGRYTDDIVLPNMTFAHFVRSPHAHAKIVSIDTSEALAMKGVVAIFTGQDMKKTGIVGVPAGWQVDFINGDRMKEPPHALLVWDKARHVGDGVAMVIAESRAAARDAAEAVVVEYDVCLRWSMLPKRYMITRLWYTMTRPIIKHLTGLWAIRLAKWMRRLQLALM
jgi:aerobic carbon-monoxide dehydrogenase large subunit